MVIIYDESETIRKLSELPVRLRGAFAALATERLFPACAGAKTYGGRSVAASVNEVLSRIWSQIESEVSPQLLEELLSELSNLLPADSEFWRLSSPLAEDCVAAAIYTVRTLISGSEQEAAWSARCAYEATDLFVISKENLDVGSPEKEREILNNPVVQRELRHQMEDLRDLGDLVTGVGKADLIHLRSRARTNAMSFLTTLSSPEH